MIWISPKKFQEAPWLLLFARGELILSENPHAPRSGGLGFAARLRYGASDVVIGLLANGGITVEIENTINFPGN